MEEKLAKQLQLLIGLILQVLSRLNPGVHFKPPRTFFFNLSQTLLLIPQISVEPF